jgi:hypothetical protein
MIEQKQIERRDTRKCRQCGEEKHRRFFIPKHGITTRYDYLCNKCRDKRYRCKVYMPPNELQKRVADGLMTEEQKVRIEQYHIKQKQSEAWHERKQKKEEVENTQSWNRMSKIILTFIDYLRFYKYPNDECREWGKELRALVDEVREYRNKNRKKFRLPEESALFWYDVMPGCKNRLRELITRYPLGEDKCPVRVM